MEESKVEGVIFKKYSGFYYVQNKPGEVYECRPRGKIKCQILTGDRVQFTPLEDKKGVIEEVLPRRNELQRPRIANVDTILIVMAYDKPAPSLLLLDRLLFLAAFNKLQPWIILNKCDLPGDDKALLIKEQYTRAGFNHISTSATEKIGIGELKKAIAGKIAVLAGPSGAGKSSLLNALIDGRSIKTGEVSLKIGRGKHTTRHVELYPLETGGWVADTPGFSVVAMPSIDSRQLFRYFPDLLFYATECRYNDCLHHKEKECGIKNAVKNGDIAVSRYNNYIFILEEIMENERCYR